MAKGRCILLSPIALSSDHKTRDHKTRRRVNFTATLQVPSG
jgi:hypothetical protein